MLGCIVKEVFPWDRRELMKLCGADAWKYKIWQNFLEKKLHFRSAPEVKKSNFPKMSYISRSSPVVQKLEQLEQNRKKHLKAHSAGYRRLHIGFELKSVYKVLEVIKGQNSILCENSFSWINIKVFKLETIILTSMCFARRAGSKHILDDLDRSISKFDLRSSQVKVMC